MVSPSLVLTGLLGGGVGAAAGYLLGGRNADGVGGGAGESEQRYRALAENFPDGSVALFDANLVYEVVAGQLFDRIDVDAAHFEGDRVDVAHTDAYAERFREHYEAVLDGEEATFEFGHGDRTFQSHLVPVTDENGTVVKGLDITQDVTGLRERERALEESEERYRALAENFPRGSIALLDENRRFTLAAGQVFDYVDVEPEDFLDERLEDLFLDSFVAEHGPKYDAVFEGEEATFEMRHGDRFYRKHLVPVHGDDGGVAHCLEMTRDITPLRERERALAESERRYRTLAEYFPRGVVSLFDDDLRYTLTAGGVFEYIDLEPDDFEGHTIEEAHAPSYIDRHRAKFEACLAGESSSFEFSHAGRDYRTRLVPVTDDDGTVVSGMSLTTDITDLKERERRLERQNERLDEFASLVSHDLRNPLQVAQGRLAMAAEAGDSEHVDIARDALGRMDALIDDVLAMARDGQSADRVEVHLETAARKAWDAVETPGASLRVEGDLEFEADEQGLARLLENLFRNAVEHGGDDVAVTVGTRPDGFYVADDGPGIPAAKRDTVLEKGYSTAENGTGFGLAIVAEVAEAHGWDVTVGESADGGARFAFSFAAEATETDEPAP